MSFPLVSICIPTYNGAKYLQQALDSILSQTYKNIEVVISDDASEDETLDIIKAFEETAPLPVKVNFHQPTGIGANWNNSMAGASGEYIKFLFQDDVLLPDCIKEMVAVLQENNGVALVASKRKFIVQEEMDSPETEKWMQTFGDLQAHLHLPEKNINIFDKSLFKSPVFYSKPTNKIGEPSAVMFRKSVIKKIGFFDLELKQTLDYEYWYRILKHHKIAIINKPLVQFRLHGAQATNINRDQQIPDYEFYPKILYKHYFWLLHPQLQKQLFKKYNRGYKFYVRVRNKLKRAIKSYKWSK